VIALLALRFHALQPSGALAAWVAGTLAVGAGWDWGIYLVVYFVAASALSRYGAAHKARVSAGRVARPGARDAIQVVANGGVYMLAAGAHILDPSLIWIAAGAGALAASAADTWATEVGSLSHGPARSIVSLAPVFTGTSGGITMLGLVASAAASGFAALVALMVGWSAAVAIAALAGGVVGSLLDSVIGATAQARWWCDSCAMDTESRRHSCGAITRQVGGWRWLNNDGVNLAATIAGAAAAMLCVVLLP